MSVNKPENKLTLERWEENIKKRVRMLTGYKWLRIGSVGRLCCCRY
jgi:hypothetical protein